MTQNINTMAAPKSDLILDIRDLTVHYVLEDDCVEAVNDVSIQLKKGRNQIIVKTACSNYRSWNVFLRFTTAKKIPLMPPLKQAPAKAPARKPQK